MGNYKGNSSSIGTATQTVPRYKIVEKRKKETYRRFGVIESVASTMKLYPNCVILHLESVLARLYVRDFNLAKKVKLVIETLVFRFNLYCVKKGGASCKASSNGIVTAPAD